jgi:hypothetical protein
MTRLLTTLLVGIGILAGCAEKAPPPRTVTEFLDNPMLLEAAMVRCSRNRNESRYDAECINAREAVNRVQAKEEEAHREELEARSERKRKALRRTQQATAEARRRAEEAERLRKEAEYLAQFGVLPPAESGADSGETLPEGNLPTAAVPESGSNDGPTESYGDAVAPTDGGNAPVAESAPEGESAGDLDSIRDELQRRSEEPGN